MLFILRVFLVFLLFYSNISALENSQERSVTFEMMRGKFDFIDILERKKKQFTQLGLNCYIYQQKGVISLRCNNTYSTQDYKKNIKLLKKLKLRYTVVPLKKKVKKIQQLKATPKIKKIPKVKKIRKLTLKDGYKAYQNRKFIKAYRIFLKLYQQKRTFANSYAMATISLQQQKFKNIRFYLKPFYLTNNKASKLYYTSIVKEYYFYTKHKRNKEALALQKKYIRIYPELKELIKPKIQLTLKNGYDAYEKKDFIKAKKIFLKLYTHNKNLKNSYALALIFLQEKRYERVRKLLNRYKKNDNKSSTLFYESIVAQYYNYIQNGRNSKALELQKKYIKIYPKLKNLIKPKPKYDIQKGYDAYNRQEYDKALFIFSMLYFKENNLDTSYALATLYFKQKNYKKVRHYLKEYIRTSDKASKLFYDSIVAEYKNYIKATRNVPALELKDRYIKLYPELSSLAKPVQRYNLKDGYKAYDEKEYDKALFIFTKLYTIDNNLENSYAISLIALHNKNYAKVRQYIYYYKDKTKKTEKIYYDSIIQEYAGYMKRKEYIKAIILLKKFKTQYPQFQKMNEALVIEANLLIKDGSYYKAEKLLRENDFKNTRDLLFEGVYKKASQLKKAGKEIEALKMIVPYVAYYRKASQFYIDISFKRAEEHLKYKEYNQAKRILNPIASISSDAQEFYYRVIYEENLDKGWNSFNNNNYIGALEFFENACDVSHQYSCLVGVMHASYKLKDDRKALASAEEVYQEDGSQESIFIAYDSAYHLRDEIKSDYWYNRMELKYKKLALFNMDTTEYEDKINSLYIDIINSYPNDFELAMHYLHFLKERKKFPEFEKFIFNALYKFDKKNEQTVLNRLDKEYKHRKFTKYFNNEKYLQCFNYGNKILTETDDAEYKRIHGWCAFYSKHYDEAEKIFENINLLYGRTVEDTDAQFLSAFNAKNYEKATKLLDIVYRYTSDEEQFKKQSEYFIEMNQLKKAKQVALTITNKEEREELEEKIKESYKYNRNEINLFAGGIYYNTRSIEDERHIFTQSSIPLDIDIYSEEYGHYYIDADILSLYDEFKGDEERESLTYGLGYNYNENKTSTHTTFVGNIGVETKYITLEMGSTPIGADISPQLTGFASLHGTINTLAINLKIIRKRDDDSMLSSVGESLDENGEKIKWGRVFRSGMELGIKYNSSLAYDFTIISYPSIQGYNLKKNSETKVITTISYSPISDIFTYIDYGFSVVYDTYDFNSDLFTYGHGGYFSPQKFISGDIDIDIADIVTDNFYWKFKASVGYESVSVDPVEEYPLSDSNSEGLEGEEEGYEESGLSFKVGMASSYSITKLLDVVGSFSYTKMSAFTDIAGGISFIYSFDKKHKVNLYNFHDSHRMEF